MIQGLTRRGVLMAGLGAALMPLPGWVNRARASVGNDLVIGVQLYMLRELLAQDFNGTLAAVARTGIHHVEFAGFHDRRATDLAGTLKANDLIAVSAHAVRAEMTDDELGATIDFCAELGVRYICAAAPLMRHLQWPVVSMAQAIEAARKVTLDDIRESADRFNRIGEKVQAAGMQFAYHTHGMDFRRYGDTLGFDEMMQRTDPGRVVFEIDIGNAISAGADPIPYLQRFPDRFKLVHVKDWPKGTTWDDNTMPRSAPLGEGIIDWMKTLRACTAAGIDTCFIEQESIPAPDVIAALRQDHEFLRAL